MKMRFHNDNECYLLFGKEINKIIAMLQILKDNNPNVEQLPKFIDQLIHMRSYDEMLDSMIMSTRADNTSKKEKGDGGLSLNEILDHLDIRKWNETDRKN
tara:strand:- start:450 stop:749 length:300 start_codon:yes stop_codon:yes gene_type:complete